MRRDAVEEEAVVRHDEHRPAKPQDRLLQRAQRADVQVVARLVEDRSSSLPPSRTTDGVAMRARRTGAARHRRAPARWLIAHCSRDRKPKADTYARAFTSRSPRSERLALPTNGLEDGLAALGVEGLARLVDRRQLDGAADLDLARRHGLLAREHFDECGLPRAVRADDADDRRPRHLEAQVVDEDAVADLLPQALGDDDLLAETGPRGIQIAPAPTDASSAVRAASTSAS